MNILHATNLGEPVQDCFSPKHERELVITKKKLAPIVSTLFSRTHYGIVPISHLPNVRNMDFKKINTNAQIQAIAEAMGLKLETRNNKPKYDSIIIVGKENSEHFIGLIINLFHYFWPKLLKINNFICSTELDPVTLTLKNYVLYDWSEKKLDNGVNACDYAIMTAFDSRPEYRDYRKQNLCTKKPIIKYKPRISISSFVEKTLGNYYYQDVIASIPSVTDGLKPLEREIFRIMTNIKRSTLQPISVKELCCEVLKNSKYCFDSIYNSINSMVQNNLPMLVIENFCYSELYKENCIGKKNIINFGPYYDILFNKNDDLNPIIPMVLVNKLMGISTGYSTCIYPCHPIEVCDNLVRLLNNDKIQPMKPYLDAQVDRIDDNHYRVTVLHNIVDDYNLHITGLPHNTSHSSYLHFLNNLALSDKSIKSYSDKSTHDKIDITIKFQEKINPKNMPEIIANLKLLSKIDLTNMHLIDSSGTIKKYDSYEEILSEFYQYMLPIYEKMASELVGQNRSGKEIWLDDLAKFKIGWQKIN